MKLVDVRLSRFIQGSPEDVFDVWFDPASPGGPWHGAKKVLMNVAVDGVFYFGVERSEIRAKTPAVADVPGLLGHFGRFTIVARPGRVEHTWMSEHTRGLETTVAITFESRDGGTQMTLVHRGIPDDEMGRRHEGGWTFLVGRMAARFEAARVGTP